MDGWIGGCLNGWMDGREGRTASLRFDFVWKQLPAFFAFSLFALSWTVGRDCLQAPSHLSHQEQKKEGKKAERRKKEGNKEERREKK